MNRSYSLGVIPRIGQNTQRTHKERIIQILVPLRNIYSIFRHLCLEILFVVAGWTPKEVTAYIRLSLITGKEKHQIKQFHAIFLETIKDKLFINLLS